MTHAVPYTPEQQDDAYMHLLPAVDERLYATYDSALPYHNWGHADDATARSLRNRSVLISAGAHEVPGLFATTVKAKGHDGGMLEYFRNPSLRDQYPSPEEYSMALTAAALRDLEVDETTIDEITGDQLGTKAGERCKTVGSYCLCSADVGNTSEDYDTVFMPKMPIIHQDFVMLHGTDPGEETFADMSLKLLSTYYAVNLSPRNLSGIAKYFQAETQKRRANLERLATERATQAGVELISYAKTMGVPVLRVLGFTKDQARSMIKNANLRKNVA